MHDTVPANAREALGMLESAMRFLAGLDAADMPAEAVAETRNNLSSSSRSSNCMALPHVWRACRIPG